MKNILILTTGGTIASGKTDNGLAALMDSEEILSYVPSIYEICNIDTMQLFNLDSTNMEPKHWCIIAKSIKENYEKYDGFVVLHGTDTMSYTAAALSYLIQKSPKPIVITGSQRPIDNEITDGKMNLYDSLLYASDDNSHDVTIVFSGHVIAGTRARKTRTKSFNAFRSINFPDIAEIRNDNHIVRYIQRNEVLNGPEFHLTLNTRILVLKLIPGIDVRIFDYLKLHYDVIIIESFGVGGIPCNEVDSFMNAIADWVSSGKLLVVTTQVTHEGSDMAIYNVGSRIKNKYELIEAYDMTLESVITKLMWILSKTKDFKEIKELFYTSVNYDIIL